METLGFIILLPLAILSLGAMSFYGALLWRYILAGILWIVALAMYSSSPWLALAVFMIGCLFWVSRSQKDA